MRLTTEKTNYIITKASYAPMPTAVIIEIDDKLRNVLAECAVIAKSLETLQCKPELKVDSTGDAYFLRKEVFELTSIEEWFEKGDSPFMYIEGTEKQLEKFIYKYHIDSFSEITELFITSNATFYFSVHMLIDEENEANEIYVTNSIEIDRILTAM